MNIKLSSHGFLFPKNINRRENKAQIPLIIHQNEKKLRIYFWCAAKDNWASQISDVALRKELPALRISNQHKMLRNCLEEYVCLYRPNAWWGGEFVLSKDHSWRIAENSCVLWSENLKKMVKQHLHKFGTGFKKNSPSSPKNQLQHIQLSDTTGTSNETGFYGQMKLKN